MWLDERGRRAVTISVISLVAAVVCFGLLGATGTFDNGAVTLGGSFVGFVVCMFVLNRIWRTGGLEERARRTDSPIVIQEVLKFLDLRDSPPDRPGAFGKLSDYYFVKRTTNFSQLRFHYASTGNIEFIGSPTHPQSAKAARVQVAHTGANQENFKEELQLDIDLSNVAQGESVPVLSQITYSNAFTGADGDSLETHVDYVTGRLTMVLLMPADAYCTSAIGTLQIGRGEFAPVNDGSPVIMENGAVIYWSVGEPKHGARYAIQWKWSRRTSSSPLHA